MSRQFFLAVGVVLTAIAHGAQASSPVLSISSPNGGQRGTELDVIFDGARLADIKEVMFYRPGIEVVKIEAVGENQAKAHVKIKPDAPLGEYPYRLRTATGITELRTFFVGAYPNLPEKEPNTEFKAPQPITLNVTVNGIIDNEDVDHFVVDLKKGDRLSAEVEAIRLGMTLFDPYVAILDEARFELSALDDSALALQDGFVSIVAPKDGKYIIQVRDSAYGGNGSCRYRLSIGNFPRPTMPYPAGGKAGEELGFQYLGDVKGAFAGKVKLPEIASDYFPVFAEQGGLFAPSPNRLRVSAFANVLEAEPNDELGKATVVPTALPVALNGVIEKPGDVDWFKFKMKAGEVYDIHCYARRLRSPLDSVMTLTNSGGGGLVGNDDAVGPDSYFRFQAPADGEYALILTDHLKKGGLDYVYRVEFLPVKATLTLAIPQVAQSSQERQIIAVPKGNRLMTVVSANRINFGGELQLRAEGLPKGMLLQSENMQANLTTMPVVFEAAADAPVAGTLTDMVGQLADPKQKIEGRLDQRVDLVTGPPNITVYYQIGVDKLAVAVTDEAPFKISFIEPKVPLVQDGYLEIIVKAERKAGFNAPINVYIPFLPPGVGAAASVTIPEGQTQVAYPLNANGGAQVRTWKLAFLAQANVGNGPIWVSTQLGNITIAPPMVGLGLQMAAAEQGKAVEVVAKMQVNTPFEGKAIAKLVGLPAKVVAKDVEITKDTKEVVFPVTVDKESPVGQHKSLFCQVIITKESQPILHNQSYGGSLRIDPPPPAPAVPAAAAPVVAAATPAKPAERRLTRLEQLRLEHAERLKAAANNK